MIINLTDWTASPSQRRAGVGDLPPHVFQEVRGLLNKDRRVGEPPTPDEIQSRVQRLAEIAASAGAEAAMVDGPPYIIAPLEAALRARGITPVYSFTKRVEEENPETGVWESFFKHIAFV